MHLSTYLILLALLTSHQAIGAPLPRAAVDSTSGANAVGLNTKKDVFISRGWGAGGMPFSVLYMTPLASKAPGVPAQEPYPRPHQQEPRPKALSQVRTAGVSAGVPRRKQYSIIPQLFISYGWGPLGK